MAPLWTECKQRADDTSRNMDRTTLNICFFYPRNITPLTLRGIEYGERVPCPNGRVWAGSIALYPGISPLIKVNTESGSFRSNVLVFFQDNRSVLLSSAVDLQPTHLCKLLMTTTMLTKKTQEILWAAHNLPYIIL